MTDIDTAYGKLDLSTPAASADTNECNYDSLQWNNGTAKPALPEGHYASADEFGSG